MTFCIDLKFYLVSFNKAFTSFSSFEAKTAHLDLFRILPNTKDLK